MDENQIQQAAEHIQKALEALGIDCQSPNTVDTPRRVAKMWGNELFSGLTTSVPEMTSFPVIPTNPSLILVGPIDLKSTCAHHLMPITGSCWIGFLPGPILPGLSKYARIVDWCARRPTIQEDLTGLICQTLYSKTSARFVGVVVKAKHACMSHRGIKDSDSMMETSAFLTHDVPAGSYLEHRSQLLSFVRGSK